MSTRDFDQQHHGALDLSRHTVLLTGGLGGLGPAIVRRLADHGATVGVVDTADDGAKISSHPRVRYHRCDVTDPVAVRDMVAQSDEWLGGRPTIVCCHAGVVGDAHPVQEFPLDAFRLIQDVNTTGSFLVARAAAALWREHHEPGHLIFTTSWVSDVPWPGIAPYSASKAAIKSLMRSFARELAPYGIRSNALSPGIVGVGMAKHQWDTDPDYRTRAARAVPLGSLQTAESVADAFLFLCSDLASYMTGSTLLVDGGASLYPLD
ncbi:SDR family NAD(P)-dependent oxidoreductase [Rhodococcus sp. BE178]|uniref:SDR family NAD(P)-dependent oxidoreductase n=1 Tax=Rhodococcus sp. BE178 TaxID=2817737 RepID=UPI003D1CD36C